jgi:hypothetical protein
MRTQFDVWGADRAKMPSQVVRGRVRRAQHVLLHAEQHGQADSDGHARVQEPRALQGGAALGRSAQAPAQGARQLGRQNPDALIPRGDDPVS